MSDAHDLVKHASAILLDFDGPVCSIFASSPAAQVADRIRTQLGALEPPIIVHQATRDPLQVLRAARDWSPAAGAVAEELLAAAELSAVSGAEPTDGAREFLELMQQQATPVAIVSNNGAPAIEAYLKRQSLADLVTVLSARDPSDPHLMKPHPNSLRIAMSRLECDPATTIMIGDSESDVTAARASALRVVAYANRESKARTFEAIGADAVIASMRDLLY